MKELVILKNKNWDRESRMCLFLFSVIVRALSTYRKYYSAPQNQTPIEMNHILRVVPGNSFEFKSIQNHIAI